MSLLLKTFIFSKIPLLHKSVKRPVLGPGGNTVIPQFYLSLYFITTRPLAKGHCERPRAMRNSWHTQVRRDARMYVRKRRRHTGKGALEARVTARTLLASSSVQRIVSRAESLRGSGPWRAETKWNERVLPGSALPGPSISARLVWASRIPKSHCPPPPAKPPHSPSTTPPTVSTNHVKIISVSARHVEIGEKRLVRCTGETFCTRHWKKWEWLITRDCAGSARGKISALLQFVLDELEIVLYSDTG